MAYLHKHNDNNHPHNLPVSIPPQTHQFPHPLHQSHSVSSSIQHSPLFNSDRISRVIEPNNDINSIDFDVGFGLGFVLHNNNNNNNSHNPNCDDDFNSRFIVADSDEAHETDIISVVDGDCDYDETSFHLCWDAFRIQDNNRITPPNPNPNPNPISNSNTHSIANSNAYANEDFEWQEVDDDDDDDRIDEREALSMFFGEEPDDDDASVLPVLLTGLAQIEQPREQNDDALEWQVLSNVHNFGPDIDSEDQDQYDEDNYAEYEMMFFAQFGDNDVASLGRPPASKTAVVNLSTVIMTQEDAVNDNALCAVCKDAVAVGEMATQLPCSHRYHGDCILTWLAVRNTCPVCRYELLTDDPDYERRKAERSG